MSVGATAVREHLAGKSVDVALLDTHSARDALVEIERVRAGLDSLQLRLSAELARRHGPGTGVGIVEETLARRASRPEAKRRSRPAERSR